MVAEIAQVVRLLGLVSSVVALFSVVLLGTAAPGSTGFHVPWRYWGAAAGLMIEVSGIYSRFAIWNDPLSYRDVTFLAINICIIVASLGAVLRPDQKKE